MGIATPNVFPQGMLSLLATIAEMKNENVGTRGAKKIEMMNAPMHLFASYLPWMSILIVDRLRVLNCFRFAIHSRFGGGRLRGPRFSGMVDTTSKSCPVGSEVDSNCVRWIRSDSESPVSESESESRSPSSSSSRDSISDNPCGWLPSKDRREDRVELGR